MKGRRDMYVGTVDGWPEIGDLCDALKEAPYTHLRTVPLMLVAGDHAVNDMAGDAETSWKCILTRRGYQVECVLQGLGVLPGVQEMYRQHLRELLQ